ncbi:MAG: DUF805 domain-containing protein [Roseobacter sp.]|jgi:uncharacterized membrane protein YhaH (DUF805 family)|nr:DUF805 domain-containing protein [Roseobacter sp.]
MTFKQSILTCLRKYFTFSGRATRSEYWWFFLFCVLGGALFGALEGFINGITRTPDGPTLLSGAFNLATFIPSLAVGFRRMHDTGRSGLYLFYPLIAVVGLLTFVGLAGGFDAMQGGDPATLFDGNFGILVGLALLVIAISPFIVLWWLTRPSQPGQNQYGPNPQEVLS